MLEKFAMIEAEVRVAKRRFQELVARAAAGEPIVITRRGKPIAMLVPFERKAPTKIAAVVRDMLAYRDQSGPKLGRQLTIRKLIETGRR
jgi:prevent-host-death family protein